MIYLFFILLFLFILENNTCFVLLFSPIVYLFMRMAKSRDAHRSVDHKDDNVIKRPSLLILYVTGFIRYYDLRVGKIPSHHIRSWVYRNIYLMDLAKSATIYYGAQIRKPFKIKIGRGSVIGDNAILDGRNGIEIGENVTLASNVSIWTEQHDHRDPYFRCGTQKKSKVTLANRTWIGPNTIILHSVAIGEGAVVGAGAVVTKSINSYDIVAGIPAKKIGERNRNLLYDNNLGIYNPFL